MSSGEFHDLEVWGTVRSRNHGLLFRKPRAADGVQIHALVKSCQPLALNSVYSYLIMCKQFADTCVVTDKNEQIVAFLSGYRQPASPDVLFCWQVAVSGHARRRGIGKRMLKEVLARPICRNIRYLDASITKSNTASMRLFRALAREFGVRCEESDFFPVDDIGRIDIEPEYLFRIGPLNCAGAAKACCDRAPRFRYS